MLAPRLERALGALALLVFCLPLVATGPILRVVFGPGDGPAVTLAALAVYYTTFLALMVGLRAVPRSWLDLVRSHGRGAGAQLRHVRAAAALPYLAAGLQIAAPAAVLGAMVGEFTGAERGLGVLTIRAMRALDTDATWTLAALAAGTAMAAYAAIGAIGRRLAPGPPALLLAPPPAPRPPRRARRAAEAVLIALAALALWQGAMDALGLSPFFAKRPGDVLAFLVTGPDAAAHRATLLAASAQTLGYAVPGYLAGLALGAGLACAVVLLPGLATTALPAAIALRSVPIVATAPLLVLALGRGAAGTIAIVAVMIFFPALVASLEGLRPRAGAGDRPVPLLPRRALAHPRAGPRPGDAAGPLRRRAHGRPGGDPGRYHRRVAGDRQGRRRPDGVDRLHLGLRHAVERDPPHRASRRASPPPPSPGWNAPCCTATPPSRSRGEGGLRRPRRHHAAHRRVPLRERAAPRPCARSATRSSTSCSPPASPTRHRQRRPAPSPRSAPSPPTGRSSSTVSSPAPSIPTPWRRSPHRWSR